MADNNPFKTFYEEFIYKSRYSRWLEEGRREDWKETVNRYVNFMVDHLEKEHGYKVPGGVQDEVRNAIYELEVMPSMRSMMTAGPALDRSHVAGYNCSYLPIDDQKAFDEGMYILMCG